VDYADTSGVAENTLQIMNRLSGCRTRPEEGASFFQQSVIPEHAELHCCVDGDPAGLAGARPTYKEALENVKDKDLHNYGFLGYPVLQTPTLLSIAKRARRFTCRWGR